MTLDSLFDYAVISGITPHTFKTFCLTLENMAAVRAGTYQKISDSHSQMSLTTEFAAASKRMKFLEDWEIDTKKQEMILFFHGKIGAYLGIQEAQQ